MSVRVQHYNGLATDVVWPCALPWLREVEKRADDVSVWEIYNKVLEGTAVLFLVSIEGKYKAAAVCELVVTGKKRSLWIPVMGGDDMAKWIEPLSETIAEYAQSLDLESVECAARPGVAARLRAIDNGSNRWKRGVTHMKLELNNHG